MRTPNHLCRVAPIFWLSAFVPTTACFNCRQVDEELTPTVRQAAPRYLVTSSEIQATGLSTALEALRRLRPEMLTRRANVAIQDPYEGLPVLYVDRVLQGNVELLNTVPARVVREIRYYSPVAANHEIGVYHPGGVIAVTTRK